jgi:hypothetical protein
MKKSVIIVVLVLCLVSVFAVTATSASAHVYYNSPGYWANHVSAWYTWGNGWTFGDKTYTDPAVPAAMMLTPPRGDKTWTVFNTVVAAELNAQPATWPDKFTLNQWLIVHPVGSGVSGRSEAWQQIEPVVQAVQATFTM